MTAADIPPIARLKDKAREVARQYRKATGTDLQHARALDAVAAQYGFATWAALVDAHGAADAGHANARKAPAVGADAVAYPSLPALLAGREPDASLLLTLSAATLAPAPAPAFTPAPGPAPTPASVPASAIAPSSASAAAMAGSAASGEPAVARDLAVFSDFRRGVQRYAVHRTPRPAGRDASARARETGAFVTIERLLKPLRLPLQVASRQRVDAPLWPQPLPLTGPQGDDAAAVRAWLPQAAGPLVAAEAGWLSEAARLLRPVRRWTFGRRDAAGRLVPMPGPSGAPLALASRRAAEAMILWYAGELGAFEPMPLDAPDLDAAGPSGQHAALFPSIAARRTDP